MRFGRRKITYYDTEAGFEAEKFAARLLLLLMNEMRASGRRQVVFLCIGTDRSTGDSLGPLIGSRLEAEEISNVVVIGTLEHPVHAVNLDRTLESCGARDTGKRTAPPGTGRSEGACRRG